MSESHVLATKLRSEGERVVSFFTALTDDKWEKVIYSDGSRWRVRDVLEHLIQAEASLRVLFEQVAAGGEGAPAGFDIERFNHERTGKLAASSREELLQRFMQERRKTAEFAGGLTAQQLALRGRHPAMGDSTIEEMLKMIYLHNAMHMRDIKKV